MNFELTQSSKLSHRSLSSSGVFGAVGAVRHNYCRSMGHAQCKKGVAWSIEPGNSTSCTRKGWLKKNARKKSIVLFIFIIQFFFIKLLQYHKYIMIRIFEAFPNQVFLPRNQSHFPFRRIVSWCHKFDEFCFAFRMMQIIKNCNRFTCGCHF